MSDFAKDKKENYPSYQQQLAQQAQADYNFAEDKAKNYPSTGVAEAQPVVANGQQAVGTVTTGQENQPVTTPIVAPQQPVSTAVPAGNGGVAATQSQQTGQAGGQPVGVRQEDYTFTEGQLAQMGPALEPEKPKYLAEWTPNSNVYEEAKRLNIPLQQALADYWRWGKDTGNPTSWMDYAYQDMDLSKTPEQIEEEQKRQERKERWDKVGNFLLHLGNVIGNQAGGGYGTVQLEDPIKYTERQRLLKEKTLERRRAYNQSYFARMRQEDADRRRAEMERARLEETSAYHKAMVDANNRRTNSSSQVNDAKIKWYNAKTGAIEDKTPEEIEKIKADAEKSRKQGDAAIIRANKTGTSGGSRGGSSGFEDTYERDRRGRTTKHVRKPLTGQGSSSSSNTRKPAAGKGGSGKGNGKIKVTY